MNVAAIMTLCKKRGGTLLSSDPVFAGEDAALE